MDYTQEMNLVSASGYCMPFEERDGEVKMLLGYGEQAHPKSGETFFHHGVDFGTHRYILAAVADGVVTGIGSTPRQGLFQVTRYGKYEVTYAHLARAMAPFGAKVKAGSVLAISGDLLHMEVRYDGEEINPIDFLTMIYGNLKMMQQQGHTGMPDFDTLEMEIPTDYDDDREEIEQLMLRFYPDYLTDIAGGQYKVSGHTVQSLRNIFSLSAIRNYFYEVIPSLANPLGIGSRSIPIAAKVQNLLIGDFLDYLAFRHGVFLSTLDESGKKKRLDEAVAAIGVTDPLEGLEIDVRSFDIPRLVTVYPDRAGLRWWTKAWFNNKEDGEASVEINRQTAVGFIHDEIAKDTLLEKYYPKQMEACRHAIEQTKEQLMKQLNIM